MFLPTLIVSTALSQGSDSVEWFFFDLETNGETAEFFSTTPIRPNGETYDYFWTLLSFEIQLTNDETGFVFPWEDISNDLPVEYFGGDGTVASANSPLPGLKMAMQQYADQGVSMDKIVLGFPWCKRAFFQQWYV